MGPAAIVLVALAVATVKGLSVPIDQLRTRRQADVGSSLLLLSNFVGLGIYTEIFPDSGPVAIMQVDRKSGRNTVAEVYETLNAWDATLPDRVRSYADTVLKRYNRTAVEYLNAAPMRTAWTVFAVTVQTDAYGYPFFTYLNDTGADVEPLCDNVLFYKFLPSPDDDGVGGGGVARFADIDKRIRSFGLVDDSADAFEDGSNDGSKDGSNDGSNDGLNDGESTDVETKFADLQKKLQTLSKAFRKGYPGWLYAADPSKRFKLSASLQRYLDLMDKTSCIFVVSVVNCTERIFLAFENRIQ